MAKAYSEPSQTSKMENVAETVNDFYPLTSFRKTLRVRYLKEIWICFGEADKSYFAKAIVFL